jgi:superfamily II DNA or RNA helicase
MTYAVGSLVRARGREWIVLPESLPAEQLLVLRPLGGTDDEITGIYTPLELVEPATFELPDPRRDLGNARAAHLLVDALRLGFRAGAGPFRCLARIAVEPRPYQLVPLLMALQLDPVRLLIADDVGVGKTIEALLIARELLDRGEIHRIAVLCPPHLAEQWQRAMNDLFHLGAVLVLAGTAARLERDLPPGELIFEHHPVTVVSMDYIKSERRCHAFLRACPELVIVDEAHTCTSGQAGGNQRRHDLLRQLAAAPERHLLLVTATPHSGDEANFRSLITLLDPELTQLPADLGGDANRKHRERLARHLVQRRRGDLQRFHGQDTPFPRRESAEEHYTLARPYRDLLDRALNYCREQVRDPEIGKHRQRVRWWSALALLRALASSPAAAAATLRRRAAAADTDTDADADELGRRAVLDLAAGDTEDLDITPGAQSEDPADLAHHRRLLDMARAAEALAGPAEDHKLKRATALVRQLLDAGHAPILFCRFIPTAHYLAEQLRAHLPKGITVESITGELPPEEREDRVARLAEADRRVLVCTDCLSEGINLQDAFDAVLHYDLAWNPTRHEQREGRVDRYGQPSPAVRAITLYGQDNPIDGIVLEILLRKHRAIHDQLGITVPVPMDTNAVTEAIFEGLLLRDNTPANSQTTFEFAAPQRRELDRAWNAAADRERQSRTIFAQNLIKVEELTHVLAETRLAIGDHRDVQAFVAEALTAHGAQIQAPRAPATTTTTTTILLHNTPRALRDAMRTDEEPVLSVAFQPPAGRARLLTRTHPLVEGLASYVLQGALDPLLTATDASNFANSARRCAAFHTDAVATRTTLLLLRLRFHLITRAITGEDRPLLAEDLALLAFEGSPDRAATTPAAWLSQERARALTSAAPSHNIGADQAVHHLTRIRDGLPVLQARLQQAADDHGKHLLDAHRRVRRADARRGVDRGLRALRVEAHPPDVLGLFLLLPSTAGAAR